jgi:flagellar biosynthetic protein FliR
VENPFIFTVLRFEAFLLIFMRVGAMLFVAPVFGGGVVPTQTKALFSMVLSLVLLPMVRVPSGALPLDIVPLGWLGVNELLVGLVMGASLI